MNNKYSGQNYLKLLENWGEVQGLSGEDAVRLIAQIYSFCPKIFQNYPKTIPWSRTNFVILWVNNGSANSITLDFNK